MEKQTKDFIGKNGFVWFIGVVEDRKDPLKLGRCKVRCLGWHSDNRLQVPTSRLPWAEAILPLTFANMHTPKDGDMVLGFFKDGENAKEPVMLGIFPNIPSFAKEMGTFDGFQDSRLAKGSNQFGPTYDLQESPVKPNEKPTVYPRRLDEPTTSRLARGEIRNKGVKGAYYPPEIVEAKKAKKESKVEPDPYYNAVYPFNNVYESESGHALEFDDTKDAERIHLYHRSGSYTEWGPEGDRAERIQRNKFEVVVGNEEVYVKGDVKIYVDGDYDLNVTGDIKINGKKINLNNGSNGAARKGDLVTNDDSSGDQPIKQGSSTVVIGD